MIAKIIKIQKKASRYGGFFYHVFFKGGGQSYFSYIYPKMRNFARWKKVLKVGFMLSGLRVMDKNKRLIDADSRFSVVED